jgi:hypothetical protein
MVFKAVLGVLKVLVCVETFFRGHSDNNVALFKVRIYIYIYHIFILLLLLLLLLLL